MPAKQLCRKIEQPQAASLQTLDRICAEATAAIRQYLQPRLTFAAEPPKSYRREGDLSEIVFFRSAPLTD
jgi:hypothetical protein